MRLSIITINYNNSESTINLLKSLENQTDKDFQIIVADNASEKSDFDVLDEYCNTHLIGTKKILIRNSTNLGFSGGNNLAIEKARQSDFLRDASGEAKWLVLLNNDTWVESGFIATLKGKINQLEGSPSDLAGNIIGIPLIEDNRTAYYGQIEWLKPMLKHGYNPPYSEYLRRNRNYYAIGGAMLIHENIFDTIGFLDEKYFLYFEDADFNIRAKKRGVSVRFIDEPKVWHQVSKTTKKLGSPLLLRYHYRNALYFNLKNGPQSIKIFLWPWSLWVALKQCIKILFMYRQSESIAILSGIFDFYTGKMGRIKL